MNLRDWVMGGLGHTYLLFWGVKREERMGTRQPHPLPTRAPLADPLPSILLLITHSK